MERLNRLVVAAEYDRHAKKLNRSNADQDERKNRLDELKQLIQERSTEIKAIDEEKLMFTAKQREVKIYSISIICFDRHLKHHLVF